MLQNNPYKLTSQVALAPDPQLTAMMEKYKSSGDAVAFSVVFNEIQRRKEIRDAAQSKMAGGPKQKVADQLIQEAKQAQMPAPPMPQGMPPQGMGGPQGGPPPQGMPPGPPPQGGMPPQGLPPQGLPEQMGIGQLPAPNIAGMADGGIVAFAGDHRSDVPPPIDSELSGSPLYDEGENEDQDQAPDQNYPRTDSRSRENQYRDFALKSIAEDEAAAKNYQQGLAALGKAYAGAEDRAKEMEGDYAREAQQNKANAWMRLGATLMQSRGKGLSGIGEAVNAALPEYTSGLQRLAAMRDKRQDYLQMVQEARRAEARGDLSKAQELMAQARQAKLAAEGKAQELGMGADELQARRDIANISAGAKGGARDKFTLNQRAAQLHMQADDIRATDPRTAAALDARATQMANEALGVPPKQDLSDRDYLEKNRDSIMASIATLNDPKSSDDAINQARKRLNFIAVTGNTTLEDLLARFNSNGSGGSSGGGGGGADPLGLGI